MRNLRQISPALDGERVVESSPSTRREGAFDSVRRWLLWGGLWTLIGFTFAATTYVSGIATGRDFPVPWWAHLKWMLVQYYIWGAFTPLVVRLVRRFPVERGHRLRDLAVYALAAVLFAFAWAFIFNTIYYLADAPMLLPPNQPRPTFIVATWNLFVIRFATQSLPTFLLIVIASHSIDFYRRFREEQLQAAELKTHLANAQLQSLRTQLNPHFLFNTLNAITELVYEDAAKAERTITRLSDLLRLSLKGEQQQEVRLKDELDFTRKYIELQQTLLQERLTVRWSVPDETLDACVPNMILQPLIENAIRHGLAPRAGGGTIEIEARREHDTLRLCVRDDGLGMESGAQNQGNGIGLANTRARLRYLYPDAHEFHLGAPPGNSGVVVSLAFPFREDRTEEHDEDSHADR